MNKKVIIILVLILILVIGGILYFKSGNKSKEETDSYQPQEEISDEQLRQTIVSLYFV